MNTIKCYLYRFLSVILFLSVAIAVTAQGQLSIYGGTTISGSDLKKSDILDNGWSLNTNLYLPFWSKETAGLFNSSIGVNVGFSYLQLKNINPLNVFTGYNTLGQADVPSIKRENDTDKRAGLIGEGGLQANLSFGKITFSPILNIGYLSLKGSESNIWQETTVGDQNYEFDLLNHNNEPLKGLILIPKLRISYFPGRIGLFAEANYTSGGEIRNRTSTFKPSGNPVRENYYDLKQMLSGENEVTETNHKFRSVGLNAGITISLGGEPAKANINTSRSNIKQQISVNTSGPVLDATEQILVEGKKRSSRQIIVTETDEQGRFELKNLKKGVYEFTLTNPSRAEAQDFNTTRSNRDNRLVINPQTGDTTTVTNPVQAIGQAQDFNTVRSNRERGQLVNNSDNPNGGIVVKVSKALSEITNYLIVDDQGKIRFDVLEAGNYNFIILSPDTTDEIYKKEGVHLVDPNENLNDRHIKDLNNPEQNKRLKTKHDTAKNSISNIR